jgi:hypothetical protein
VAASREHYLDTVNEDGTTVTLDDGSVWEIAIGDNTRTLLWYAPNRIQVKNSEDKLYPYTLTNLDTAGPDEVRARREQ